MFDLFSFHKLQLLFLSIASLDLGLLFLEAVYSVGIGLAWMLFFSCNLVLNLGSLIPLKGCLAKLLLVYNCLIPW